MELFDIDFVDGLSLFYKPNSADHKALLLASSDGRGHDSIMPFTSWVIAALEPDGWGVSVYIFSKHFSHELVSKTGQFTVNVPRDDMDEVVEFCGSVSGRDHDKFAEMNLTRIQSTFVTPPVIGDCAVQIECETRKTSPFTMTFPGKDHEDMPMTIFTAEILAIHAAPDVAKAVTTI